MERLNRWLSMPSFNKIQLIFYTISIVYVYFSKDYFGFLIQVFLNFMSFMTYRYRMRNILSELFTLVNSNTSDVLKLHELEYNIKKLCELYNIELLKQDLKLKKKRDKTNG